ncbi:hypothetical protein ABPG75_007798 [Micractinium tetrahymenae]
MLQLATALRPAAAPVFRRAPAGQRRPGHVPRPVLAASAPEGNGSSAATFDPVKYEHILLAILDSNPVLSSASRNAVATAASLAASNSSKLTVMFIDEQGQQVSEKRLQLVQGELLTRGLEAAFLEEEVEAASQGKGSAALGEAADNIEADLVVLTTAAVHEKHVDANLLAEFVGCPILLLP